MPEDTSYFTMGLPSCVVVVERRVDHGGVAPVDEFGLSRGDTAAVDSERIHPDVPKGDGVDRSLHEHHVASDSGAVVEEEPSHIDTRRVEILGTGSTLIQ